MAGPSQRKARRESKVRKVNLKVFFAFFALLASFALITLPVKTAYAQAGEPTDDEVNAVASQLYCPVCENTPLDVCPTLACSQWRATIKEKLSDGWNEQQIKDYFVAQYGERVLAQPSARGLNILVWVLPPIIVLVAGVIFIVIMLRLYKPVLTPTTGPTQPKDEYVRQLEEELAKRR